jgi:hypothetical protein
MDADPDISLMPADRLRLARLARGFASAKQFADRHGIPQPTYAMHETGRRGLSRDRAVDYAGLLDVDPEWLLFGTGKGPAGEALQNWSVHSVPVGGAIAGGKVPPSFARPGEAALRLTMPMLDEAAGAVRTGGSGTGEVGGGPLVALLVSDASLGPAQPAGSVLVLSPLTAARAARPGDCVLWVAEGRGDEDGRRAVRLVRIGGPRNLPADEAGWLVIGRFLPGGLQSQD